MDDSSTPQSAADTDKAAPAVAAPAKQPKVRVGVPLWRTGKPDSVLAAAVDLARNAVLSIAAEGQVGVHLGVRSEGERVATHLFESKMPGYLGWQWFAVLTRVSRSKTVTVNELGLLPSAQSVLAPEWVPWADRVRPGDDDEAVQLAGLAPAESSEAAATGGDAEREHVLEQDAADAEADTHN
ncbi:DUF3027 domain-containing protein [Paeniglutamicibacter antarcticus]|uniref:DUF3027 domain-containing protein n=1 Tax=Arthrobacter terrae TaxID=2935737 RepID=A0A931G4F8_9MICC|nr:DUF3027 domain-containing protein [Arthrobacter terrae]MBG0739676.1 DUF3027 domain-containing protein [Arthrobacter terrae]